MTSPTLALVDGSTGSQMAFQPERLILAGYTGRDRAAVQAHIDELAAQGIAPPDQVPALYPGNASGIQVDGHLPAGAGWSSGEVEFVLFVTASGTFVGVGSDHTDRILEQSSIVESKRVFAKVIGAQVWPVDVLQPVWDQCRLRSWVTQDGKRTLYQEGVLGMMMTPRDLLALLRAEDQRPGLVLFSGTVPAASPAPPGGACLFEGELLDPDGKPLATCQYGYLATA